LTPKAVPALDGARDHQKNLDPPSAENLVRILFEFELRWSIGNRPAALPKGFQAIL